MGGVVNIWRQTHVPPVRTGHPGHPSDGRVQTFGKRCQAAKRDPNCPVVIRGWLNKKDSSGLKLWKRRWFVLSNYCLFYYKDSREESVLGSIPLPSYKILFCTPRECKNRKFTFKVSSFRSSVIPAFFFFLIMHTVYKE
uniref:PH domain-containing protein n=1 Tax=Seriola dumerili TaxID=41447 RepID=A0A3B4T240_SERDU